VICTDCELSGVCPMLGLSPVSTDDGSDDRAECVFVGQVEGSHAIVSMPNRLVVSCRTENRKKVAGHVEQVVYEMVKIDLKKEGKRRWWKFFRKS